MKVEILYVILSYALDFLLVQGLGSKLSRKNDTTGYEKRILYGEIADPKDFPYMARLYPTEEGLCGGSIISNDFILTTGHCIWNVECTDIRIFPSTWMEGDKPSIHATHCYPHDNYVGRGYFCDIALIKTRENLVDDLHLVPINLPKPTTIYLEGASVVIAGWGMAKDGYHPNNLKRGDMVIHDFAGCNYDYQHADQCTDNGQCPISAIPNRSRCVMGVGGQGAGTCHGDSGGPVVKDGFIIGVMAGTILVDGKCSNGVPTLYMNVVRFLPWIQSYLAYNQGKTQVDEEPC